ncbi:bifunctional diaminohydroxyphosphoribosylaminopyrimidine deaminase/5-amino-6-(5-phosphoribosylamino)uracil reductase RibD [Halobacteriovorax sp. DA5]|uniref:bifunctional diaminohydroxyphosphoribosylaminopyrimidine deaminase/5-amino-6-(5-phosphoribosylamino)uracil reductase RibD n=1 Tax=Halobacteriovorax sp. DA5 TaxID=2067553 RepID=UPI000CD2357B|nr:bifunctional diaminohydroxyphosphoribosylaminopyrimidine deaminase/5-amino-6-(5-phosphoribosylamino)uracil reductase RibD [Halobacteriovorax sp. DA5]POB13186.1 bifunctional diaminohydroxyphosphoribosylaminopyrimidine deaminase/5-amino-6-(5-phosphoribosylamino)uracil reductase RibD [Halobacteriovorax sp. DA5]
MENQASRDIAYMQMALNLAKLGEGTTSPNPMVGAVIVKDGIVLGKGWHKKAGLPHAEPEAIADVAEEHKDELKGATIYVTLEPCCHTNKRTPPCAHELLKHGFARVVVACLDPNPQVAGNGIKILEAAGIECEVGVLEQESMELNRVFFKSMKSNLPFVHLKLAQTLDGKLSTMTGDSKWITDESARKMVHSFRKRYDGVMVGRKTLNNDDPSLNIRFGLDDSGKIPYRIVMGSISKMDPLSKVFNDQYTKKTIIVTTGADYQSAPDDVVKFFTEKQIRIVFAKCERNEIVIEDALAQLKAIGVHSILVEGGGMLASTILKKQLADKMTIFVAPKILGNGIGYYDEQLDSMADALNFKNVEVKNIGSQAMFEIDTRS